MRDQPTCINPLCSCERVGKSEQITRYTESFVVIQLLAILEEVYIYALNHLSIALLWIIGDSTQFSTKLSFDFRTRLALSVSTMCLCNSSWQVDLLSKAQSIFQYYSLISNSLRFFAYCTTLATS